MRSISSYRSASSPSFEISLRPAKSGSAAKAPVTASKKSGATARDKALVAEVAEIFEVQLRETLDPDVQGAVFKDLWDAVQSHLAQTHEHLARLQKTFRSLNRKPGVRRFPHSPGQVSNGSTKAKKAKHCSHMMF